MRFRTSVQPEKSNHDRKPPEGRAAGTTQSFTPIIPNRTSLSTQSACLCVNAHLAYNATVLCMLTLP